MYRYILKRLLMMIPVLIGVTFVVFFILALTPGDPAKMILGDTATQESIDALRVEMGLDDPLILRYARYLGGLVRGDLGRSYKNNLDVATQVLDRFPNTLVLTVTSMFIAVIIGIPVGILSARKQYTWMDNTATVLGLVGVAMPSFWQGLLRWSRTARESPTYSA